MKRKICSLFTLILTLVTACCLFSCQGGGESNAKVTATVLSSTETALVFRVDEADEGASLYDAMQSLKAAGEITFESQTDAYGEMLTSLNGVENGAKFNPCWMSYTTDADESLASPAYTPFRYDGKDFNSCNFGMSSMTVKEGELYAWVYVSF